MRITSAMINHFVSNALSSAKAATYDPQMKIATGRRVLNPSDDLVATNRILDLDHALTELDGMERIRNMVQSDLDQADSLMGDITEMLTEAHTLGIQMGSDGVSPKEREDAAARIESMIETLAGYANHQRADGRYLFNGVDDQNPPFVKVGDEWQFQNTTANRTVEVAPGLSVQTTLTAEVFDASGVFDTLRALQNELEAPADPSQQAQNIRVAVDQLSTQISAFGSEQSKIGHRLNGLQQAETTALDMELRFLSERADLRDVDLVAEITNLSMADNALSLVMETSKRFMSMNLKSLL